MQFLEQIKEMVTLAGSLLSALKQLPALIGQLAASVRDLRSMVSYENVRLEALVDILDNRGHRALVTRTQRVKFLTPDAGVIRELIWGDGETLASYSVEGARLLCIKREGSKQVALLAVDGQANKGAQATVTTRRLIRKALNSHDAYAEMLVERPTRRVALKVLFPLGRPPHKAYLTTLPPDAKQEKVNVRYGASGRPFLAWKKLEPDLYKNYSLRWQW